LNFFKKSKWGLTLSEVLITTSIIGIFLGLVGVISVDSIKAFHRGSYRLTAQQQALLAIDRLCRELNESHSDTITLIYSTENGGTDTDFDAICFGSAKESPEATGSENVKIETTTGYFRWMRFIVYSKKVGEEKVYRTVLNFYDSADPVRNGLSPYSLTIQDVKDGINNVLPPPPLTTSIRQTASDIYLIGFTKRAVSPVVKGINIKVIARVKSGRNNTGNNKYETTELTTFVRPWR